MDITYHNTDRWFGYYCEIIGDECQSMRYCERCKHYEQRTNNERNKAG